MYLDIDGTFSSEFVANAEGLVKFELNGRTRVHNLVDLRSPGFSIGSQAPAFELMTLGGERVALADLKASVAWILGDLVRAVLGRATRIAAIARMGETKRRAGQGFRGEHAQTICVRERKHGAGEIPPIPATGSPMPARLRPSSVSRYRFSRPSKHGRNGDPTDLPPDKRLQDGSMLC